jgi:hypothetical protein
VQLRLFKPHIGLPQGIDADNPKAKFMKGVLKVTIPKKQEALMTPPAVDPRAPQARLATETQPSYENEDCHLGINALLPRLSNRCLQAVTLAHMIAILINVVQPGCCRSVLN